MSPINERYIKGPFKPDFLGGIIWGGPDGQFHFADVRGWGELGYKGDGAKIQDANLQFMVDALNEKAARNKEKPPSEAARTAYERLARYIGPQSEHRKNQGPLADVVINELEATKKELEEAKKELAKHRGPECKDKECPDYDGAHPFHDNEVERFWREKQKEYVLKSEHERLLNWASKVIGDNGPDLGAYLDGHVEVPAVGELKKQVEWLTFYKREVYACLGPVDDEVNRDIRRAYVKKVGLDGLPAALKAEHLDYENDHKEG